MVYENCQRGTPFQRAGFPTISVPIGFILQQESLLTPPGEKAFSFTDL